MIGHRISPFTLWILLAPAVALAQPQTAQPATPPQPGAPQSPTAAAPAAVPQTPAAQPADQPPPPPLPPPGAKLTPDQLDGLVAPIALYPDPLVSQILVASTYPREVTLAVQWLNQHPELKGKDLNDAAQQQPWDPSIRSLVIFPSVIRRLNQDKVWTTNLGNAFLAQQADVMKAIQRMRKVAKEAGKLSNSRRIKVVETTDSGETVIQIVPANPNVLFVPVYNPVWIWGPPLWYPYPRWFWGPPPPPGVWIGFGGGIAVGAYFGPVWGGWGGWGWSPGWVNNTVVVNNTFINNTTVNTTNVTNANVGATAASSTTPGATGTSPTASNTPNTTPSTASSATPNARTANTNTPAANNTGANTANSANANSANLRSANTLGANQTSVWTHDPAHRQGVPYPNAEVAQRFHAPLPNYAQNGQPRARIANGPGGARPLAQPRARTAPGTKAPPPGRIRR